MPYIKHIITHLQPLGYPFEIQKPSSRVCDSIDEELELGREFWCKKLGDLEAIIKGLG